MRRPLTSGQCKKSASQPQELASPERLDAILAANPVDPEFVEDLREMREHKQMLDATQPERADGMQSMEDPD
jgi:hypothetical protein